MNIRAGMAADVDRVNSFYARQATTARVTADEQVVLAEQNDHVVGVVRLCLEHGHLVLRTMRVREDLQRKGIGKQRLRFLESLLNGRECYCLPYAHLTEFYGVIGFLGIPEEEAPLHLQERLNRYRAQGGNVIVMKRPRSG